MRERAAVPRGMATIERALACAALLVALALSATVPAQDVSEDDRLRELVVSHRQEMVRVTEAPFHVLRRASALCLPPVPTADGPHGDHWIHVFVSPPGREAMTTGKGTYPAGTVILKQKFLDPEATKADFYTGMRKREPGYHPQLGDWEFFTLDTAGTAVTARGRIESCSECHSAFAATDFVARTYAAAGREAN